MDIDTCSVEEISAALNTAHLRMQALELAIKTPNVCRHEDVVKAATAYEAYVTGKAAP